MPNYTFEDMETGEKFVEFMKMDQKEYFLEDNPTLQQVFTPISLPGDHLMGLNTTKESGQFQERMSKIPEAHPHSPLADKYTRRTHKEVKIKDSLNRVRKKMGLDRK